MRERYLDAFPVTRRLLLGVAASVLAAGRGLAAADCARTSRAIQGPYWRPDAPETADLRRGPGGEPLVVRGVVRGGAPCAPLAGALLEVWQADEHGKYDADYGDGATFLRARVRTRADGSYEFRTVRPAPYGIGRSVRPAHIHFIVRAAGHRDLVTQLYFSGDPHLQSDPLAAVHPDLVQTVSGGAVTFDLVL